MTAPSHLSAEDKREWLYRYHEMLGMQCEDREPSAKDIARAVAEANRVTRHREKPLFGN